jgi:hypothetical protein
MRNSCNKGPKCQVHCETKKIHRAVQKKWRAMLTPIVVLLHDNACLHTAAEFQLGVVWPPARSKWSKWPTLCFIKLN